MKVNVTVFFWTYESSINNSSIELSGEIEQIKTAIKLLSEGISNHAGHIQVCPGITKGYLIMNWSEGYLDTYWKGEEPKPDWL